MKINARINHNEKPAASKSLIIKTDVRAGLAPPPPTVKNHNEKLEGEGKSRNPKALKTKLGLNKETIR